MQETKVNPYFAHLTDPLFELDKRRQIILSLYETNQLPPVFAMPFPASEQRPEEYLVYNGNKRTVIARELLRKIPVLIIQDEEDLKLALAQDPRLRFPSEIEKSYNQTQAHLLDRARHFSRLNERCGHLSRRDSVRYIL